MMKGLDAVGIFFALVMSGARGLLALDLYGIVSSGPLLSGESRYSRGWELLRAYVLALGVWVCLAVLFYQLHPGGEWWVYLTGALRPSALFSSWGKENRDGLPESRWRFRFYWWALFSADTGHLSACR